MDYNKLLDVTSELGYRLAMCGAETYRIEESVNRIMQAYGVTAEAFAIPNCLHISIITESGESITRMRRIGYHGNDLDAVERFSNISRKICVEKPSPTLALEWINEVDASRRQYSFLIYLIGNFLGALGFAILFGASYTDSLCAGVCGIVIGLINHFMDSMKANQFFRIILASFVMAIIAYFSGNLGIAKNVDSVIIGSLMILVPGLLFTNAMRDIIHGDTNSGINRIVQVLLIAVAIALGTAAAWNVTVNLWRVPAMSPATEHHILVELLACSISSIGFIALFNIHGKGNWLCVLGACLTWFVYRLMTSLGSSDILAYFFATMTASFYSEITARIRKYPAISYLVISAFPLIPGAGVYYAMSHAVRGEMEAFASRSMHTAAIAGVMAVGILVASTTMRIINDKIRSK